MKLSIITSIAALSIACNALPTMKRGITSNYDISLVSDSAFCSFMPPKAGDDVGATENDGVPYCTNSTLGGQEFPSGFIKSAHFVSTADYTQVTGTINRDAYSLSSTDGGGQYDNRDINGVTCNGYKYFVNLIEPDSNTFCIRCCKDQADCRLGISTFGCARIVPGNYD